MALPHLPATLTTRKNIYEAAIVRGRTHEQDFRQKWDSHANYFHKNNVTATKQQSWESPASFNASMEAWKAEKEKEEKAARLESRRKKLDALLQEENDLYQAELYRISPDNYRRLQNMKERSEGLRTAREERRKRVADELLYEHWRTNNPDIRQLETEQHKQHVIEKWGGQVTERQQREEELRREKELFDAQMEEERLAALELEREKEEQRLEEERALKQILSDQVQELREREAEAKRLKANEEALMDKEWKLEELELQYKAMEKERKKLEFGRVLLRQHAAALKRKSQQIQQELEEDRKFLEQLAKQEVEDREVQTARREKEVADASWMKKVIEDQIRLEKAREAELDMLYQDEAARVWEKRENEWARERAARERLMREVLLERQEQIQIQKETVRLQQQESLQRREQLLRQLEIANQMTRREAEEEEEEKLQRKQELEAQMTERRERQKASELQLNLEQVEEQEGEKNYEELLRQEAERLTVRGYEPRGHGRRQAWQ